MSKHPDIAVPDHSTVEQLEKVTTAKQQVQQLSIEISFEQTYRTTSDKH